LVYEKEAYVQSLVTSKEIKPFVKITNEDLGVKKVLKSNLPKDAIQDPDQIIGKITNTIIKSGSPIYANQLDDAKEQGNKYFISVPVDLSRAVGGKIKPGDIVDVYWVDSAENMMWRKISSDVVIADILDSSGNTASTIINATGIETRSAIPTIMVLAVEKEQVNSLIGGSASGDKLVLVKKLYKDAESLTGTPEQSTPTTTQNSALTQNKSSAQVPTQIQSKASTQTQPQKPAQKQAPTQTPIQPQAQTSVEGGAGVAKTTP
jgi:pilus assembly protein CpaB